MNKYTQNELNRWIRINAFANKYRGEWSDSSGTIGAIDHLAGLTPRLEELSGEQATAEATMRKTSADRRSIFGKLERSLRGIVRITRSVDPEQTGFSRHLQLNHLSRKSGLIDLANTMLDLLPDYEALLLDHGAKAGFLGKIELLRDQARAIEAEYAAARLTRSAKSGQIRTVIREGRQQIRKIDAAVRVRYEEEPEGKSLWSLASRRHDPYPTPSEPEAEQVVIV